MKGPPFPRQALLWLAGVRILLGIVAIPLAPFLYKEHFLVLVLLRPTKEVLLAAGFLARRGEINLLEILIAAVPLMLLGVWQFYYLGRMYSSEIRSGKDMPNLAKRLLPQEKIKKMQKVLKKKGNRVVFLGRLAAFPSALIGAAAGASNVRSRKFFPADGVGALLSIAEVVGAGYILGETYDKSKPWITLAGVAVLAGLLVLIGWYLRRE